MFFNNLPASSTTPLQPISVEKIGKVYADVPLNYFNNVEELKNYVKELKQIGVNTLLILPHFKPSLSPYVVADYEQPCSLFGTWEVFTDFMKFVENLGMDRMIDIPFNHADWCAVHLKREWYKNYQSNGIEAGADDEDADGNKIRVNWGAFILDNSNKELQDYWLEKVIYPHIEERHVNAIRIDAAWGLDSNGLKRIVQETKKRYPNVWFLTENLGMAPLIKLAESGISAGADRFFNNMYWYNGGIYVPTDVYKLYKRSNGVPTATIYSSHDTLMPAMKNYSRLRANDIKGMNNKAIVRQFVQYDNIHSVKQFDNYTTGEVIAQMKLDFALSALMSTDLMFVAGSEKALFEANNVCSSIPEDFTKGVESDLPNFMQDILNIKRSEEIFNCEGTIVPFGFWKIDQVGIRGYVKTTKERKHAFVAVNNSDDPIEIKLPKRIRKAGIGFVYTSAEKQMINIPESINLLGLSIVVISC